MKNQYEQFCNAAALEAIGVPVLKNLKEKRWPVIKEWLQNGSVVKVNFPDETEQIIDKILENHTAPKTLSINPFQENNSKAPRL